MKRLPTWVKITTPVVLLLGLVVAALVKVMVEELPEYAQEPAIEGRFGQEIETLLELARANPSESCTDADSVRELIAEVEVLKSWWILVDRHRDDFGDPAILGADVVFQCEGATKSFSVKSYEEPGAAWSRSVIFPHREWPAVSLWYAGEKRLVRYEDRLEDTGENPRGIRLILDLESLTAGVKAAPGPGAGFPRAGDEAGGEHGAAGKR